MSSYRIAGIAVLAKLYKMLGEGVCFDIGNTIDLGLLKFPCMVKTVGLSLFR